ncbi:MAG: acyltransferase [Ginsengibacter sp.]
MISKLSDVQSKNIGEGTDIWQFCVVLPNAVIGRNCNINCQVFIENDVFIGDNVTVKPGVQIWDGLVIEDNVFIGSNVTFTNNLTPRSKVHHNPIVKTVIKKGVSLGANATILAGITINEYAMIGAGSFVNKDIPPFTLWYGSPARNMGFITKDAIILDKQLKDKLGRKYELRGDEPVLV